MRKLVCFFAVICFAAPAFAGDITFTVSASGNGQFTIGYSATASDEGPVGIGLKVTLDGACSASVSGGADVVSTDPCFSVFIDYAHDMADPNNYTVTPPYSGQHPLADPCGAGVPDPCSIEFSICMGRLDPCNLPPDVVTNLVTIDLYCDGDPCCVVGVTIEEDGLRGGIVGADWGSVDASDSTTVWCADEIPEPCLPACWNDLNQCNGDFGTPPDGLINSTDFLALKASYLKDYCDYNDGAGPYNPCADADHDGYVNSTDFLALKEYYLGTPPGTCPGGGTWPPFTCP